MLIIRILQNTFKLYLIKDIIRFDKLKLKNTIFSINEISKECEGFMGFFDWLRSDENTIIGIRICFFDYQIINPILKQCANAKISNDEKYIELLFAGKEYDPTLSGDQDFTNNYIYKSNEDDYLFTFGLDHLTENELKSLLNYSETLIEDDIEGIPLT